MSGFHRFSITMRMMFMCILILPVFAGLVGVLMPAFGFFPALGETAVSLKPFSQLFANDNIVTMSWLSFSTGIFATLLALGGALLLVAVFYQRAWLNRIQHLLSPLLVVPHAAAAIAFLFILSPSGWLARLFSDATAANPLPPDWAFPYDPYGFSIILALTLKELPFIFLMLLSTLSQPQIELKVKAYLKVAQSLGYSHITAFIKIVIPMIYPHIRMPLLAVLAFATANVEIPLILGPNDPPTLAVAVLRWFNNVDLSMRFQASAAAVLQLIVTLAALLFWYLGERGVAKCSPRILLSGTRQWSDMGLTLFAAVVIGVYALIALLLVGSVFTWSVATYWPYADMLPQGVTFIHWQTALRSLAVPLGNSVLLAFGVTVFAVILVLLALEGEVQMTKGMSPALARIDRSIMHITLYLPLLVPGVAFLFGLVWFQQMYFSSLTWLHLFVSHLIYVLPYVFISLAIAYRRIDPRYIKVAYGLGKTPLTVFFAVKLPMLVTPIAVAFALGLAISFSQYLPTLLSAGGNIATVTTEAVAAASGSSRRLSAVYVVVQIIMPLCGFILAWWLPNLFFKPSLQATPSSQGVKVYESNP
ncbi:ABC transporter permease [Alteromonas sp. C1M14]|uniref:ABC transporter permease n=1 Tax=Alteromonas sp. C1M14 TaxID=2841567 RepID=UPI001C08E69D|nr:ABC transporter permease [Alteromonas sp. C1M14]MBU2979778.1 ABC transporter permease [Alteromonas sp. C1M14]